MACRIRTSRGSRQRPGVRRWLLRSFVRAAIVPLILIEVGFLAIFLVSNTVAHDVNVAAMKTASEAYLESVSRLEADQVEATLFEISRSTQLLANSTALALDGSFMPPPAERARYGWAADGAFYTRYDNGTTASFYSGAETVGPEGVKKVWKLAALDPLMMDLERINPLVASVYVNTYDSYNRIYPYFEVLKQYPRKMRIPDYNFYYAADARHNPARKPTWTEAYVDPAGHGWMISSIAPVWRKGRLEAVVGQDVTIEGIIAHLLSLKLPWGAYAMLVDDKGQIIAMPPAAERDLAIKELTRHDYGQAIHADTTKPPSYNLHANPLTRPLALALSNKPAGFVTLPIANGSVASFHEINGPEWRLVIVAERGKIFAQADQLRDQLSTIGWTMAGALVIFYIAFFWFLYRRARSMGEELAGPMEALEQMFARIARGEYRQEPPPALIAELDGLGREIAATGHELEIARNKLLAQQQIAETAFADLRRRSEEELRFIRIVSHEVRTPLAVIDSGAQILERKAGQADPSDISRRARRFRQAVARVVGLVEKLEQSAGLRAIDSPGDNIGDACDTIRAIVAQTVPAERLDLKLPSTSLHIADSASFSLAIRALLDNAVRYSKSDTPVQVELEVLRDQLQVNVRSYGKGPDASETALVGERFFRGSNAADTDGAGLGLFLARKSLEGIGGSLTIDWGDNVACAKVSLPLARNQKSETLETAQF